jgi:hypothetical protein
MSDLVEMHVGKSTDFAGSQNAQNSLTQELLPSKHGATTENTKDTLTLLLKWF